MTPQTEKEKRVIETLERFQPRPGMHAYQHMAHAAWSSSGRRRTSPGVFLFCRFWLPVALSALLIVLAVATIWVTPPLRLMAQEVLDSLFNRAPHDSIVLEYQAEATEVSTVPAHYSSTSIAEAELVTGLNFPEPTVSLIPYTLTQATINYETETIWLTYNTPGRYLSIYRRSVALGWLTDAVVGASAEIIPVEFEGPDGETIHGEYVAGGWQPSADPTSGSGETVQQPADWTAQSAQRRLRWQDANYVYEMVAFGGDGDLPGRDLMMDGMMAIAASIR